MFDGVTPGSRREFVQDHLGGWQTLQAVNPRAFASFKLMAILLAARYRHPSRWYFVPVRARCGLVERS